MSGEQAEGALNALHPFPSPPCWAPLILLLRPQAPGGRQQACWAGGPGPEGRRVRAQGCRGSEQRRSRWEVPRPSGEAEPVRGEVARWRGCEPGAPWRSQPHPNHGFFSRLAHALPSSPPLLPSLPPSKYLPGQRTPLAGSRWINFLEHQNSPSVSSLRSGYGALSLLFKKGNVALPKI